MVIATEQPATGVRVTPHHISLGMAETVAIPHGEYRQLRSDLPDERFGG